MSRQLGLRNRSSNNTNTQNGSVCREYDATFGESLECQACTQVGIPVFHSTSYTNLHQPPQWEASAGSCLSFPNKTKPISRPKPIPPSGPLGPIIDPRKKWVGKWNRAVLVFRGLSLIIDSFFFYTLSLSIGKGGAPCLSMNYLMAVIVTLLRSCFDAVHVWHLWMQFRTAYVSRESLVIGRGKLMWDPREIVAHNLRSLKGFWCDVFVVLPLPQAIYWLLLPKLMWQQKIKLAVSILLLIILIQSIAKLYHFFSLIPRMSQAEGYLFNNIWWSFGLTVTLYLIFSHMVGGWWFALSMFRVTSCLNQQCAKNGNCNPTESCGKGVCYQFMNDKNLVGNTCGANLIIISTPFCLNIDGDGAFAYGIYDHGVKIVTGNDLLIKIFYSFYWGLIGLSSYANELSPSSEAVEVCFSIFVGLGGMTLLVVMVGFFQVFLGILLGKNKQMQLRSRQLEWWMRRRRLPSDLRTRIWQYERQNWEVMGGPDQMNWLEELPVGLRRDIKRYLCLDLIKKVPLFHTLEDLILENICDRVKPLIFSKNEKIIREGDPVNRMIFIIRGRVKRCQNLAKDKMAISVINPGGFLGDELLGWSLRRPFVDRLTTSSATFVCTKTTEAFGLEADDLRYITEHFRYRFSSGTLRRTLRYYSSNWRTWASVIIQLGWRRYKQRRMGPMVPAMIYGTPDDRLRRYAALFMSLRPNDQLE